MNNLNAVLLINHAVLCKQKFTCYMSWFVYTVAVRPVIIGKHDKLIHVGLVLMFTNKSFVPEAGIQSRDK